MEPRVCSPGTVVFAKGWPTCGGRRFRSPKDVFTTNRVDEVQAVLDRACRAAERGFHVAGFVAYEGAPAFDPSYRVHRSDDPLAWFATYEEAEPVAWSSAGSRIGVTAGAFEYHREEYAHLLEELREHIREGNVYQVNFTGRMDVHVPVDPYLLFEQLIDTQPVSYGVFVDTGREAIVSCSPELFFERRGRQVTARPMKGTVRRGRGPLEDEVLADWLTSDDKSRAENLMIVDLLRNDLSRCCEPGSVHVTSLFEIERYETLHQMTSQIEGTLSKDAGTRDVFASLFPCGSVTGAPKIRAMEIIRSLEHSPRGVYCGAIGYLHKDMAVFNVAIRTLTVRDGRGRLGLGSGIVWDSEPSAEFDECLLKSRFLTDRPSEKQAPAEKLIETMRSERGRIPLLSLHAERARTSSRLLGYHFDEGTFVRAATEAAPKGGDYKVRVLIDSKGYIDVEATELSPDPPVAYRLSLSHERIRSTDPYRRHKTTSRHAYEKAYQAAVAAGYDEVLFMNERDEVVEGSRTNVFAVIDGTWITPPVTTGALPGVYRRLVFEMKPEAKEGILCLADLLRADELFLCNAVRGLIRAKFSLAHELPGEEFT